MTAGDARFVELYDRYYRHVYAYCRRRLDVDRVEDAVAETFLVVWKKVDRVPDGSEALPWIYAVAYRVLNHQWRSASRQGRLSSRLEALGVSRSDLPEDFLILGQESDRILEALSRLQPKDREVLRLHVWEELAHKEIAEVLELSVEAVKKRFSRAKDGLAKEFNRLENKRSTSPAAQKGGAW